MLARRLRTSEDPVSFEPGSRAPVSLKIRSLVDLLPAVAYRGKLTYMKTDGTLRGADISFESGSRDRRYNMTRYDALSVRFGRRTIEDVSVNEETLDAIARFNYHLYRFNTSSEIAGELKFHVRLHRLVASMDHEERRGLIEHELLVPDAIAGDLFENLQPELIQAESMPRSPNLIPVREIIIGGTMLDSYYGLSLSNDSHYTLFFHVIYLDPNDYSILVSLSTCDVIA